MSKLEIKSIRNGYIVKTFEEQEDNNILEEEFVFEERDNDIYQRETTQFGNINLTVQEDLLNFILDYFGIYYSKHNDNNLIINIEKNGEKE